MSADNARPVLHGNPLAGTIVWITEAATAGWWLFGDLLYALDNAEAD
jgi:hypothetical protein